MLYNHTKKQGKLFATISRKATILALLIRIKSRRTLFSTTSMKRTKFFYTISRKRTTLFFTTSRNMTIFFSCIYRKRKHSFQSYQERG
jgi:hypothetical protein